MTAEKSHVNEGPTPIDETLFDPNPTIHDPDPVVPEETAQPQPKRYTSLTEWRKAQLEEMALPSGLVVTVKMGVTLLDLIKEGEIPETLIGFFDMALGGKEGDPLELDQTSLDPEQLPGMVAAFNAMAKAVIVDPPITEHPTDDSLGIDELGWADKAAIFYNANEGAMDLAPFREGPEK